MKFLDRCHALAVRRVVGVNVSARSTCGSLVKKGLDGGGAKKQGGVARVHRKGCTDYRNFQDVHQSRDS